MNRDQFNARVREDLKHIPRFEPDKRRQGSFRMIYTVQLQHALSVDPEASPSEILRVALETFRTHHPDYAPGHDAHYFRAT